MKKIFLATIFILASMATFAQSIYICKDGEYTKKDISEGLEISLTEGIDSITFKKPQYEKVVTIVYDGTSAAVTIPAFCGVTCSSGTSADVVLTSTNVDEELTYKVSGTSSSGSLTINGEYKMTVLLDGVSLTSAKGAAIDIQCGKRISLAMTDGSTNTLADAAGGKQKACLYTKGHLELSGAGTLNVTGNANHAISAKEYLQVKKSVKAINILKAANDAIHVGQYFQMNGGELNITSTTANDGVQVEFKTDDNGNPIEDEENTGEVLIKGGTLNITMAANQDSKGIKTEGDIIVSGGTIKINANSNGSRGMQADGNMVIGDGDNATEITIYATGAKCTLDEDADDPHKCMGIKIDGDLTVNGGTTTVYNTGSKSKGIKVGGTYTLNKGIVDAVVE